MNTRLATAKWADPALVEEKYLYREGTVWLGRSASNKQTPVGFADDRHVCLVSGTRGGKGTSSIINNLCMWPGSAVVLDPKGEDATVTAARRGQGSEVCDGMGQDVHVLDPFKTARVEERYFSRYNPLDALDPNDEESIDRAALIADAIVIVHEGNDPFWDESGRALVKGLILHILTAPKLEGQRNLITLRKLITRGDWQSVEELREIGERDIPPAQGMLWAAVKKNPAFDGVVAGIGDRFLQMLKKAPEQFESVLQVVDRNTEFLDSPGMKRVMEYSDFDLADIKTGERGFSLYLCLPQRYMNTHYRWLRMMIGLIVMEMERVAAKPVTGHPVLMLLDEFAGLERMKIIENAVAQMAGFGVKIFFVLQSLEQLKAVYKDNWETFLANSGLKLFFNLEDHFSREYVSKLIGDTEIIREVRSEGDSSSESENESESRSATQSESTGESTSHGHSESEGRNRSSSTSSSHGVNSSHGKSFGTSSTSSYNSPPTELFHGLLPSSHASSGTSTSTSDSEGTSSSSSHSDTEGRSRGTSESSTEGRSRTSGTSTGETSGSTHGTTRGRTSGNAETIHRRPLITPDEIGQVFARVDDRGRADYPGLGLAVIAGHEPVAFHRVSYYEDVQFIGYFQPHPDHEFTAPQRHLVKSEGLEPYRSHFVALSWKPAVRRGSIVRAGDVIGFASDLLNAHLTPITSPRAGRIVSIPTGVKLDWLSGWGTKPAVSWMSPDVSGLLGSFLPDLEPNRLFFGDFEMLYYETGDPPLDPFAELAARCRKMDLEKAQREREEGERKRQEAARRAAEEWARRETARRRQEKRKSEILAARKQWLKVSGIAGLILLVDAAITISTRASAGIVIALVAIGLLAVGGAKIRQTFIDERENDKPPEEKPVKPLLATYEPGFLNRKWTPEELETFEKLKLDEFMKDE